jgi:hypothetical protein
MRFSLAMFLVLSGFVFGLLFSTRYALALYLSSLGESLGESKERAIARDREIVGCDLGSPWPAAKQQSKPLPIWCRALEYGHSC